MKKFIIGIMAILYMGITSGVAMELHYCMGDRAGMDLFGSSSDTCGKCGMKEKESGCCHDEYKFYKLEDSHKTVYNDIDLAAPSIAIVNEHFVYDWQMPEESAAAVVNNHSPPDPSEPSLCILNCVFRI